VAQGLKSTSPRQDLTSIRMREVMSFICCYQENMARIMYGAARKKTANHAAKSNTKATITAIRTRTSFIIIRSALNRQPTPPLAFSAGGQRLGYIPGGHRRDAKIKGLPGASVVGRLTDVRVPVLAHTGFVWWWSLKLISWIELHPQMR
jgi:hypothetical protein